MRGRYETKTWQYNPALYAPPRYRRACQYECFIPEPIRNLSLSLPADIAVVISDAELAIAELNRKAGPEFGPFARLLLRTESIASSKVEGMQVDARTLARAEAAQETGRRIGSDVLEVLGNIDAMQFAIEETARREEIRPEDLLEVHRVLLERAPGNTSPGKVRTSQNWIGGNDYNPCGADFVPPPPENVERLLDDLCQFCNDESLSPLAQAAIAHAQFETIHPFDDGNGRTGRALIQVLLRRRGLAPAFVPPISVELARDKARYIKGLTDFREDRIVDWLESFGSTTAKAANLASRYAERVSGLQERWREQLADAVNPRADAAAWAVIDVLVSFPVVTLPVAVAATGRTKPAVNNALAELVRAGVLVPVSESRRNRAWEAVGLLNLVTQLESPSV